MFSTVWPAGDGARSSAADAETGGLPGAAGVDAGAAFGAVDVEQLARFVEIVMDEAIVTADGVEPGAADGGG